MDMQTIFLILLFIMQMVGFYVILLLYTKVSRFNDLEKKQQKLMAEMDDSIAAYLAELKEENERLIAIIEKRQHASGPEPSNSMTSSKKEVNQNENADLHFPQPKIPMKLAVQSYQSYSKNIQEEQATTQKKPGEMDERTKAIALHDEGRSIEEIAKTLGKGKTEVELLLKFR